MSAPTRVGIVLALAASGALAGPQGHFQPIGNEFVVHASTSYDQYWGRVDLRDDASLIGFAYANGQDPAARQFDASGAPVTGYLNCNPTLNVHVQDEPETSFSSDGRQLVAWSERYGYDGEIMGIFGRIFLSGGTPAGPEFQINQVWQASQWRPLIARHPAGGWVVAWSGDWDGDAFFRILRSDGTFAGNDVPVNTFGNGAQVDTAPGVASDGTMLMVFVDFSGHAGIGTGTNLWARRFDANGVALDAAEWPLNTPGFRNGDQREPRVAVDGSDRFVVVWEDAINEGANYGIFGRRFDAGGNPLGPEFHVNTTVTGSQRNPRVAADALGNFIVCWEDWSAGQCDVRAQRFDQNEQKVGPEFVVHAATAGDQRRPSLAMTPTTGHVVFCFEGPGVSVDVYARIFTTYQPPTTYCSAKVNSLGCSPSIASSGAPSLGGADDFHVLASSLVNNCNGLLFWGRAPMAAPFQGGTLCVQAPRIRRPVQNSGGSAAGLDCTGTFDTFFPHAYMAAQGWLPGDTIYAQSWSRDPGYAAPQNVSLTAGLSFDVLP
jgi:hypothetical protein